MRELHTDHPWYYGFQRSELPGVWRIVVRQGWLVKGSNRKKPAKKSSREEEKGIAK